MLSFFRLLRAAISTIILVVIIGGAVSFWVKDRVEKRIKGRSLLSSSMILSRPFPLAVSTPLTPNSLNKRLLRLRYQKVNSIPKQPGYYQRKKNTYFIYLRETQLPNGQKQRKSLIKLSLGNGKIVSVFDTKYRKQASLLYLEPEVISLLDNSERRAINPKTLKQFPPHLIDAVISIEDERFYSHYGIDIRAIARAMFVNVKSGSIKQGGSTITQQLAKNLFYSSKRTLSRKVLEALTAIFIETAFSKDEILEFYLNEVFLGQEGLIAIHGFGEAAFAFFGKDVSDLSISESATLAGIIKAPSAYSPRKYPKRAKKRRDMVLSKMLEQNVISKKEALMAHASKLRVLPKRNSTRKAPYFIDFTRKELREYLTYWPSDLETVSVHTGLDYDYQQCGENAVKGGIAKLAKRYRSLRKVKPQAALLSISLTDQSIRAWVGGHDYNKSQFCRISQAMRQPGSAFKPIVFLTALDGTLNNYRTARTTSLLADEPLTLEVKGTGEWSPKNYDQKYHGDVTVRQALVKSYNIPSVNLALKVGMPSILHSAQLLGISTPLPGVPSIALGSAEVKPLELAQAYKTIASGCQFNPIRAIESITSPIDEEPLYTLPKNGREVCSENAAYILTNILQSAIEHGTGRIVRRLGYRNPVAGKTGTSNDARDSWFVGYTPTLLTVVWVGYDGGKNLGLTGSQAAAPIWTDYMKCTEALEPRINFIPPQGVVFKYIDNSNGLLWTPYCSKSNRITEVFVKGTEPITPCHRPRNGQKRKTRSIFDGLLGLLLSIPNGPKS